MFEIFNLTNNEVKEISDLKKFIKYVCKLEKIEEAIFNIIIVDNDKIKELNRDYRNKDQETDVITFALEDNDTIINDSVRMLGDIYISIDKAISQALSYNHSLKRELCFLAVHGVLHLLGYDHMNENEERIMFAKQEKYLTDFEINR